MEHEFIELVLTCGSLQEAHNIVDALLDKHLIACAEFFPVSSKYWWKHEIEQAKETRVSMQTAGKLFSDVESAVKAMHSYELPDLRAIPITYVSAGIADWLNQGLNGSAT